MLDFSIVVPVFNEEKNIDTLIEEIFSSLKDKFKYEIIFVDDKSTDNTINILNKHNNNPNIKIIRHNINKGQSYSLLTGIKSSISKNIVTIDGDLQNNPSDILKLYEYYNSNHSLKLVAGIRTKRKDNIVKIITSKIANKFRSIVLNDGCPDTGCGLKIIDKEIFLKFPFFNGIHRFLPALFKGFGYEVFYTEVDHRYRVSGISKYGTFDRFIKGINDTIKVKLILSKQKYL